MTKLDEIQNRLQARLDQEGYKISNTDSVLNQIDSLQVVSLLTLIEIEFEIDFESYEVHAENFKSIEALSIAIEKKMTKK